MITASFFICLCRSETKVDKNEIKKEGLILPLIEI